MICTYICCWVTCVLQVACGSGLELVYEFLLSDERANRPEVVGAAEGDAAKGKKVRAG